MAWKIIDNELTNTEFIELPEFFETSVPNAMWRVTDGELTIGTPEPPLFGAFANATKLKSALISDTTKKIGKQSFSNTRLTQVTLADDCEYYSTSFPTDCEVTGGILIE